MKGNNDMIIRNEKDLEKALLIEMRKAIQEVANKIAKDLTANIQEGVYSKSISDYYERTKNFIDAVIQPVVKIKGSHIECTVGTDWRDIKPVFRRDEGNVFNAHMNIDGNESYPPKSGTSVSKGLLQWWDEGTSNDVLPSVPATNYWYDVFGDRAKENPNYKKLDDLIDEKINKYLKQFGIVTKR
jgi:hypothetical protein